jgi:UDP-glucose 4-epimerase
MRLFGNDYPTPDGTNVRDFVHVSDLADAHSLAADHLVQGGGNLQLNLGVGKGVTVLDVLRAVERATGRPVPFEIAPRRAGDAVSLYADTARVSSALAWRPHRSDLDTIVGSAWRFHKRIWGL